MSQFSLIAQDGNEYGPVTIEELNRWRMENRLNEFSLLKRESDGLKMQAGKFPELEIVFKGPEAPPNPYLEKKTSGGPQVVPPEVPMTSSLFLLLSAASMSFLVLTLPALLVGYIAWRSVHEAVKLSTEEDTAAYEAKLANAKSQVKAGWGLLAAGLVACFIYLIYLQVKRG